MKSLEVVRADIGQARVRKQLYGNTFSRQGTADPVKQRAESRLKDLEVVEADLILLDEILRELSGRGAVRSAVLNSAVLEAKMRLNAQGRAVSEFDCLKLPSKF